jgi:hypothetical protein
MGMGVSEVAAQEPGHARNEDFQGLSVVRDLIEIEGFLAALEGSRSPQNCRNRAEKNTHVQPKRPLLYILAVKINHILKIEQLAPAADLPKTGDSGLGVKSPEMVHFVVFEISFEEWARSDERHLPNKYVEELRKFIETPAPKTTAKSRGARIVADLK